MNKKRSNRRAIAQCHTCKLKYVHTCVCTHTHISDDSRFMRRHYKQKRTPMGLVKNIYKWYKFRGKSRNKAHISLLSVTKLYLSCNWWEIVMQSTRFLTNHSKKSPGICPFATTCWCALSHSVDISGWMDFPVRAMIWCGNRFELSQELEGQGYRDGKEREKFEKIH